MVVGAYKLLAGTSDLLGSLSRHPETKAPNRWAAGAEFQYGKPVYTPTVTREPGQLMATNAKPADEGRASGCRRPRHPLWRPIR